MGTSGAGCLRTRISGDGLSMDRDFHGKFLRMGFRGGLSADGVFGDGLSADEDFRGGLSVDEDFRGQVVCGSGLPGTVYLWIEIFMAGFCGRGFGAAMPCPCGGMGRFAAPCLPPFRGHRAPVRAARAHDAAALSRLIAQKRRIHRRACAGRARRFAKQSPPRDGAARRVRRAPGERWGGICPLPPAPGRPASTGIRARWSCPPAALPQRSGGRTPCRC